MSEDVKDQTKEREAELDYTNGLRRRIADALVTKALVNEDPEMLSQAQKALDGIDRNALGRMKIKAKDDANKTEEQNGKQMAEVLLVLADRRVSKPRPVRTSSDVPGSKLPENRRPKYDDSIRDASAGSENTREFTTRIEEGR